VFNRYIVGGALGVSVYVLLELRNALSQRICRDYILFVTCTSVVALAVAHVTVIFHVQSIWEGRRAITRALFAGFTITYAVSVVSAGFVANDFQAHILWVPQIGSCVIPHKPVELIGVWAGMVAFDIFAFVLVFTNAVNRPYRQNSEIIRSLRRDGVKFFCVLLSVRFINFLLVIFSSAAQVLVVIFFLWAIVSITLSRFLLMIKATEEETALKAGSHRDGSTPVTSVILTRGNSDYWLRKEDLIELEAAVVRS